MTERPILFSGEMVRAILSGIKTQTRRVVKPQPTSPCCITDPIAWHRGRPTCIWPSPIPDSDGHHGDHFAVSKYGATGDRLWVRETWISGWPYECGELMMYDEDGNERPKKVWYRADGNLDHWIDDDECRCEKIPWRPSIHMPRWASRITLEVTGVRVERLREISEEDAQAEGVGAGFVPCPHPQYPDLQSTRCVGYRPMFKRIWDDINGKRGFGWDANPWVWVIEFKRLEE